MTTDYTNQLLKVAESQIGYSEIGNGYTKFGQWFQDTHAKEPGYTNAAWCDMFVSWAAKQVGQQDIVGQDAWTVTHAKWFENQGAWGTTPKPGALVFYNWKGAKNIDSIEHVGLVKGVIAKDKIQTIEGNISNSVVMKTRTTDDVVGYGYPDVVNEKKQQQLLAKKAEKAKDADAKTVKVAKAKDAEAAEVDPLKVVEKAKPADLSEWEAVVDASEHPVDTVTIAVPPDSSTGARFMIN